MNSRKHQLIAFGVSAAILAVASVYVVGADQSGPSTQLLGLYTFAGSRSMSGSVGKLPENLPAFTKFCGYNTLEFCDWEFEYPQSSLANYYQTAQAIVASAHREHLKAYIILLTNESRRLNLAKPNDNEYQVLFNPISPQQYLATIESTLVFMREHYRD